MLAQLRETDPRAGRGWQRLLSNYKTGADALIFDLARAADIDVAVAAYLAGVPLGEILAA